MGLGKIRIGTEWDSVESGYALMLESVYGVEAGGWT